MISKGKAFGYITLATCIVMLSTARSDVPQCDGTESLNQYCPLEVKKCSACEDNCSRDECFEVIGNPRSAPFSCRRIDPAPKVLTTRCEAAFWPPPPVGPPAPMYSDCYDTKKCQPGFSACEVDLDSPVTTVKAQIYTTLTLPDCAEAK